MSFDPKVVEAPNGHFIDGELITTGPDRLPVLRPSDGKPHADLPLGDEALVDRAVQSAARAQRAWRDVAPRDRSKALRRWADRLEAHAPELARLESLVSSRLYAESLPVDVMNSIEWIRWYAECCDKVGGELLPTAPSALAMVAHEPWGVVGAIAPWNFPLILAMWKVSPALAAGNAVVLKPSEMTPWSVVRAAQLAVEAGLPAGLFTVVQGDGPTVGQAIVRHPQVAYVAFTGSTATGRRLMSDAALYGPKPVGLELGGKGPHLVLQDADDLDAMAAQIAWGFTRNAGQLCYAGTRLVVHRSLKDDLVDRIASRVEALNPGPTWSPDATLAPILNRRQADRIETLVADALANGASARTGARYAQAEGDGLWYAPTILENLAPDARAVREEVFGPVLTVHPFDDEEEGLSLADHPEYGLTASVWTRDLKRAARAARTLQAGTVWINAWGRKPDFTAPFGGWKSSGFGQEAGLEGYRKYLRPKTVWFEV